MPKYEVVGTYCPGKVVTTPPVPVVSGSSLSFHQCIAWYMTSWENSIFCSSIIFFSPLTALSTRLELHRQPIRSGQFFLVSLFSKTDSSESPGFGLVTGLFGCAPPKPNKISLPCWLSLLMGIPCRCRQTPSQVPTLHYDYVGTAVPLFYSPTHDRPQKIPLRRQTTF